jgi:hypothetical protein
MEWKDGSIKKHDANKPVQSIFVHPFKPLLGKVMADGSIRVMNVITNTHVAYNETPNAEKDKPVLLAFHPAQAFFIALLSSGTLVCWDMSSKEPLLGSIKVVSSAKETIESVFFHGTLPFVLTVNNNGGITTWNFFSRKNNWIVKIIDSLGRAEIFPAPLELLTRYGHLPNYASKFANELVVLTEMTAHPSYNFFCFNVRFVGKSTSDIILQQHLLESVRIGVYCIHLFDDRICNMVVPQQQTLMFWASPEKETRTKAKVAAPSDKFPPKKMEGSSLSSSTGSIGLTPRGGPEKEYEVKETANVFYFPNETFLLDDLNILAYSPAYNDISLAKKLPAIDFEGRLLRPTRVVRSHLSDRFLVFLFRQDAAKYLKTIGVGGVWCGTATNDVKIYTAAGKSGNFFGSDDEFLVLSESGLKVEIWKNEEETTLPMLYDLPSPMAEVFWTPIEGGNIIWFVDLQRCRLIASFKNHISGSKFMLNPQCSLPLHPGEEVSQVAWHRVEVSPLIAAVVTARSGFFLKFRF